MRKLTLTILITCFTSGLFATTEKFDKSMMPILKEYVKIHKSLFASKTDGVKKAAEKILKLSEKVDAKSVTGKHKKHYEHVPMKMKKAAKEIVLAKNIKEMRNGLKVLSKPMAMWVTMSKPKGYKVGYCSMVKASWIQKGDKVLNPYDPSMPYCGQFVGGDIPMKKAHDHKGHSH